jgi:hypothetical protein
VALDAPPADRRINRRNLFALARDHLPPAGDARLSASAKGGHGEALHEGCAEDWFTGKNYDETDAKSGAKFDAKSAGTVAELNFTNVKSR